MLYVPQQLQVLVDEDGDAQLATGSLLLLCTAPPVAAGVGDNSRSRGQREQRRPGTLDKKAIYRSHM